MSSDEYQVFISYNTGTQQASADALAGPLRDDGYRVFVCNTSIERGVAWREEIKKAINSCVAFFALINEAYVESAECMMELNFAVGLSNRRKQLIGKVMTFFQRVFTARQPNINIIHVIPVIFKGFNPESDPSVNNVVCNFNGRIHDSAVLTTGSPRTLSLLLDEARSLFHSKRNFAKPGIFYIILLRLSNYNVLLVI